MTNRREFFGLVAVAAITRTLPAAPDVPPPSKLEMGAEVRWLTTVPEMPSVGRIIGVRQRNVGLDLPDTSYHVDFGTTRLWIQSDSLVVTR